MNKINAKEVAFQILLHVVVFLFYTFDRNEPSIKLSSVMFFLSYALAVVVLNYFLIPKFFYKKKYFHFAISLVLLIAWVIVIEELVLEQIFYPDSRGKSFPGVIYSLIDVLPIMTILAGFKFAWDAIAKQKEVTQLKSVVKESELQFLKSQINPHFLFNNLNNLYSYALDRSPKTPEIILELSGLLRYMLYECKADYVSLAKEIDQLENFVSLNKMQIEERGDVKIEVSGDISKFKIAPLILIVFIENAFKHSTASKTNDITININIHVTDDGQLKFKIKNNFESQSNTSNLAQGIGLQNVRKRLELIYPNAHQLMIRNKNEEYTVELSIQLEKQKER